MTEKTDLETPLIERTYTAIRRNGERTKVNVFDYNLAFCADKTSWIQCEDGVWNRVCDLRILEWETK